MPIEARRGRQQGKRPKWTLTPEIEAALRRLYAEPSTTRQPALRRLAERLDIPRWRLGRWARDLGLYQTVRKQPPWSPEELAILERNAHLGLDRIALALRRAGYHRTPTAVQLVRKRLRIEAQREGYSARQVALCFGVDPTTVGRWIRTGMLRARPRGTRRTGAQGGDQHLLFDADLRHFVLEHLGEIHLGKVDKHWFVSLLAGELGERHRVERDATAAGGPRERSTPNED